MIIDGFAHQLPDIDPTETEEWLDSLDALLQGWIHQADTIILIPTKTTENYQLPIQGITGMLPR